MTDDEQHEREMSMNAHFCWALAMWGSAEAAREHSGYIAASYAYYYSVFHATFALITTDHTFHCENMREIKHSKIEAWLRERLPLKLQRDHALLRGCREATSYLGMGNPANKLQVVRGHQLLVEPGGDQEPMRFFEAIEEASHASSRLIHHVLQELEKHCNSAGWRGPKRGDEQWLEEYLQEDVLRSIVPRDENGRVILKHAFSFLR